MKVLCVIDNLGSGGAQRQMVNLAIGLKKKGYEVYIFTYFPQNFFEKVLLDNAIPVINVPKKDKYGLNTVYELSSAIKKGEFNYGISYMKAPNIYLTLAAKFSGTGIKIVTSERTLTNLTKPSLINFIRAQFHSSANKIVFNSYHEKNNWVCKFPKLKKKSITIYNGVDTSLFKPGNEPFHKTYKLIGVGKLGPQKHIHILIEAVQKLKGEGIIIHVDWFGKYVAENKAYNAYYQMLYKMVSDLNLSHQWHWYAPHKSIQQLLPQYDALVLPSVLEGLPNVPCEAMSCSLPIFLADTLDHPVLVGENLRGFLFKPGDSTDLAFKIKQFYAMPCEAISVMKKNCRQYSIDELSMSRFIENYDNLFSTL